MDQLFKDGLAPSTRRAYEAGKRRNRLFCIDLGQPPLPAKEQSLCRFVERQWPGTQHDHELPVGCTTSPPGGAAEGPPYMRHGTTGTGLEGGEDKSGETRQPGRISATDLGGHT